MASFKQYTASGGASEAFSIPSFTSDEIKVRVDGVLKTAGTHYNITSYTVNGGTVTWTSGNVPSSGTVYIYRDTKILNSGNSDVEGKATYNNSSPIYHGDLNNNQKQVLRAIEEENDQLIQSWDLANGIVETDSIKDGTIVNADVNDNAAIAQSKLNIADASGSASGYMSAANFTKLSGIETGATADQTNAEIRTAVEAASDSNVFTDADHSKLNAIEAGATADQTNAEIRAAVEAATDSNVFTDADHTKLNGIAAGAEVNVQSDWNQATNTADDFIKNKPAIVELIDEDDFASDSATKSPSQQSVKAYITATSQPKDNELTTLAGMQPGTATQLAGSTALTSSTAELNLLDGKSVVTTVSGSSTDVQLPTAKAVNDQVVNLLNDVGGFVPVANRTSFPNANPDPGNDAGTIVSIADAGGLVVNSSGVATNAATLGGTTVTINGIDSTLHSSTIANGKGMLVQTTSTLNTYTYHRLVVDEAGVASAQTLVTDFNQRYQVASSTPSNQPDGTALAEGDLWFDTGTDKMKVYSGSQYDVVTSVGDYKLLTIVNDGQTSGSPTYNGSNVSFDLRDGSNAANITSVGQLLISVNGILQKPNAGSWSASNEGFHLEGTNGIKFCTAPVSGDSIFITLIGSATSVNVPATNSVVEAAIQDEQVSEQKLKVSNTGSNGQFLQKSAGTGGLTWAAAGGASSIADDSIAEVKLDIHADPSGTNKFLGYTSNGMEWAVPPDTNTQLSNAEVRTAVEAATDSNVFTDADHTKLNGIAASANNYVHPNHSGEVTSTADGAQVIATNVVDEDNLKVSNSPTNGQFLQAQSGNTGGLTWASVSASPEITGTVTGTLPDGKAVVIKTDGTLLEAKISGPEHGTAQEPTGGALGEVAVASMRQDRIVVVWNSTGSGQHGANACIGKVNPTTKTITFGSASQPPQSGHLTYFQYPEVFVFDSSSYGEMVIVSWWHSNNSATYMTVLVGPTGDSTTAPTWSSSDYSTSAGSSKFGRSMTRLGDRLIYSYIAGDYAYLKAYTVGNGSFTAGGTAVSFGTYVNNAKIASANSGAGLVVYDRATQRELNYRRFTVSGTTITLGTNVEEGSESSVSDGSSWVTPDYDFISITPKPIASDGANVFGIVYKQGTNIKAALISTTTSQNNNSSFVTVASSQGNLYSPYCQACFDSDNKLVAYWSIGGNTNAVKSSHASLSGSGNANSWTIGSWSTPENRSSHGHSGMHATPLWMTQSTGAIVFLYNDGNDSGTGKAHVRTGLVTNVTADNYIGYSNGAFTDGQTGTVKVVGSVATGLSSLTPGSKYYLQNDGTLSTTAASPSVVAGTALTSSTLLIKG